MVHGISGIPPCRPETESPNFGIFTRNHDLVMCACYVMCLRFSFLIHVYNFMCPRHCMTVRVLPHSPTVHDVQELTASADTDLDFIRGANLLPEIEKHLVPFRV